MNIHFVCRGNTYRSRLAEAYFNSLKVSNWTATSSGIEATHNLSGAITSYAKNIIDAHNLTQFGKASWTQSTKENLEASDLVVFLNADVYEDSLRIIPAELKNHIVWTVEDVTVAEVKERDIEEVTNGTFKQIVAEVDTLVHVSGLL